MKTQRLNQKDKDSESNQQPDSNTPSDSESAKNYIFHFGTTFQATPVKTFGSRTTNEKEKPVNVGFVILGSVWFTFKESCEICRNVGIAGLMMLKKLPRYSMTHLKTTSSINQKTKDVSVDGQTHQTLISSLDQIFHESTSPKCNKSRNGSVDRSHLRRICFWIKGAVV
ncbi:BnaC02g41990D [Brassica napus]|uniref:BnaC02g41990D protein n=1 Tax=Brassica napus TaxID=3708 RepID=A0A078ICG0_BRANA|nr:BnaC02g41990D [Brassica napus]